MKLTPDEDRVRLAATAPSTSNITAAEFNRFIAKTIADTQIRVLQEIANELTGDSMFHDYDDSEAFWRIGHKLSARFSQRADRMEEVAKDE